MGHVEETKHLAAEPQAVWAVVSDLASWSSWFTVHDKWLEEPPADLAVGTTLVAKVVMLGMANKIEWTVREVEAPSKLVLTGTGLAGVKVEFAFTLTARDGGSDFHIAGDFEGAMIKGALGKAVEKDAGRQLEDSVGKLEALATAGV